MMCSRWWYTVFVLSAVLALLRGGLATAVELTANPQDYRDKLNVLRPGDTLHLRAGTYTDGLPIAYHNGAPEAPIVISGPSEGAPAGVTTASGSTAISV